MNLIWHIMKKDLWVLRGPIALWLAAVIATRALGDIRHPLFLPDVNPVMAFFQALALGIAFVFPLTLVAWLMHEDDPRSSKAFWRTRPIAPARLLVAKLLTMGLLFLFLPKLILADGQTTLSMLVPDVRVACAIIYAAGVAAMTRDLRGYAMCAIGFLVVPMIGAFLLDGDLLDFRALWYVPSAMFAGICATIALISLYVERRPVLVGTLLFVGGTVGSVGMMG